MSEKTAAAALQGIGLVKTYADGGLEVQVLKGLDFAVAAGESVAILGSSGSGKSTLLHLLGGLELPSAGQVLLAGEDLATMNEARRGLARNRLLGFAPVSYNEVASSFSECCLDCDTVFFLSVDYLCKSYALPRRLPFLCVEEELTALRRVD